MKKLRMGICLLLIMVLVTCDCRLSVYADTSDGRSEISAIELTAGKAASAKFPAGKSSVYFRIALNEDGKLKVSFTAQKIASDVKVEVYRQTEEWSFWSQSKILDYNKSKKITSGSLTSEYVLPRGWYIIRVTPEQELTTIKKFKLTAKVSDTGYNDREPNFPEANAQPMVVNSRSGTKTYKMLLSNISKLNNIDFIDCFTFKIKQSKRFRLKVSLRNRVDGLSVLLCKKKGEEIEVVKRYDMTDKTLDKTVKLGKGTYFVKVWYYGEQMLQIPYTISGTAEQKATEVKLDQPKLTLWANKAYGTVSASLKATVSPSNTTNKKVTWNSSNPKVAKVSSSGKVTAVSAGKAVITVSAEDGSQKYATCEVTVNAPTPKISGSKSVMLGDTAKYKTTVSGGKWMISNRSILSNVTTKKNTLSLKAKKPGKVTISYAANGVKSNKISVTVKAPTPKISGSKKVMLGDTAEYKTTVSGGKWVISDRSILSDVTTKKNTLSLKAKKPGKVTISYVANGVKSNKISVTVKAPTPKISGPEKVILGETAKYKTTVSGGKWMISDQRMLSNVSNTKNALSFKAKKAGKVTISYVANGVKSNEISVTLKAQPKKSGTTTQPVQPAQPVQQTPKIQGGGTVWVGQSITFTVTNGVSGGSWYSGDTSILSGSGSGTSCTMTGKKAGTTYVCYKVNGVVSNRIVVQVRGL